MKGGRGARRTRAFLAKSSSLETLFEVVHQRKPRLTHAVYDRRSCSARLRWPTSDRFQQSFPFDPGGWAVSPHCSVVYRRLSPGRRRISMESETEISKEARRVTCPIRNFSLAGICWSTTFHGTKKLAKEQIRSYHEKDLYHKGQILFVRFYPAAR